MTDFVANLRALVQTLLCARKGHDWSPNQTPGLKRGGGFVYCRRCNEGGWLV